MQAKRIKQPLMQHYRTGQTDGQTDRQTDRDTQRYEHGGAQWTQSDLISFIGSILLQQLYKFSSFSVDTSSSRLNMLLLMVFCN